jgi:hypothetical protein
MYRAELGFEIGGLSLNWRTKLGGSDIYYRENNIKGVDVQFFFFINYTCFFKGF